MIQEMREWLRSQRDAQIGHMGKVGLSLLAGMMDLRKHDLLFRTTLSTPERNPALEGAELPKLIAARMLVAQQGKQGLSLHRAVAFQMCLYPRPVVGEWVGARAIRPRLFELAR